MTISPRGRGLILNGLWLTLLGGLAAGGYFSREHWLPVLFPTKAELPDDSDHHESEPSEQIVVSDQAQKNLRMSAKALVPEIFSRKIAVPGIVVDRPGFGDRGLVAPTTGVITRIHRVAGDTVQASEVLFTLQILSETLLTTQSEFYKTTQELKLAEVQKQRLAASVGVVAEARILEVDSQIARLEVARKAYRQELLLRGLLPEQIEGVAQGTFVRNITVPAPDLTALLPAVPQQKSKEYEIQELRVELGQQVQVGQTLCLLANHQMLAIEGQAFRDEAPDLERVLQKGWPVNVDFAETNPKSWPAHGQTFRVTYIANTIDPESRTFRFLIPLDNQSRTALPGGNSHPEWRFRPGQRVRLLLPVEEIPNVFVLPVEAIARDGADAYLFRQNGNLFDRKPVHVQYQDRQWAVVANDGSVAPGVFVAQTGAVSLNRMLKSNSGAVPKGFHIHADGSVHQGSH